VRKKQINETGIKQYGVNCKENKTMEMELTTIKMT